VAARGPLRPLGRLVVAVDFLAGTRKPMVLSSLSQGLMVRPTRELEILNSGWKVYSIFADVKRPQFESADLVAHSFPHVGLTKSYVVR